MTAGENSHVHVRRCVCPAVSSINARWVNICFFSKVKGWSHELTGVSRWHYRSAKSYWQKMKHVHEWFLIYVSASLWTCAGEFGECVLIINHFCVKRRRKRREQRQKAGHIRREGLAGSQSHKETWTRVLLHKAQTQAGLASAERWFMLVCRALDRELNHRTTNYTHLHTDPLSAETSNLNLQHVFIGSIQMKWKLVMTDLKRSSWAAATQSKLNTLINIDSTH